MHSFYSYLCIITASLHYFAIIPSINNILYSIIIFISTTISILWHIDNESNKYFYIDYIFAGIWSLYDIIMGYYYNMLFIIIILNIIIFIINIMITKKSSNYKLLHSIWHIMSSIKSYYIASLFY